MEKWTTEDSLDVYVVSTTFVEDVEDIVDDPDLVYLCVLYYTVWQASQRSNMTSFRLTTI